MLSRSFIEPSLSEVSSDLFPILEAEELTLESFNCFRPSIPAVAFSHGQESSPASLNSEKHTIHPFNKMSEGNISIGPSEQIIHDLRDTETLPLNVRAQWLS